MSFTTHFSSYTRRLLRFMSSSMQRGTPSQESGAPQFNELALELFALQHLHNPVYRRFCQAKGIHPKDVQFWSDIPALPAAAFKEYEVTCLKPGEPNTVFRSSRTTDRRPSRNFHNSETLEVYETSLWLWFRECVVRKLDAEQRVQVVILMPPPAQAPDSSLVHMMEIVRCRLGAPPDAFVGANETDAGWQLDMTRLLARLQPPVVQKGGPVLLLGTAFSFVHLLDYLTERNTRLTLPDGSLVFETGGYKGRSRSMARCELHKQLGLRMGVAGDRIISEYGMSELASQAYDIFFSPLVGDKCSSQTSLSEEGSNNQRGTLRPGQEGFGQASRGGRVFRFPPWARVAVVSPETGAEVVPGEPGLLRIIDLANVGAVLALQSEDLGIAEMDGFKMLGRSLTAEPKGCSLLVVE